MTVYLDTSKAVKNRDLVDRTIENPDFPYLISFPRTGSHWLRMLMEMYFGKPALIRAFYFEDADTFTCLHHHDLSLALIRNRVLYLYRDPVNTIYSQLQYYQEDINDIECVRHWANLYQKHLTKWLLEDNITVDKLAISYEDMESSLSTVFTALCHFFNAEFDQEKLSHASQLVTKSEVRRHTRHDPQVINTMHSYHQDRSSFEEIYGKQVRETVSSYYNYLYNHPNSVSDWAFSYHEDCKDR